MQVVVATHGHCFDGLASAVLFTRLLRELGGNAQQFVYRACGYGFGQLKPDDSVLSGDENAILDFRLTPSPRVTWFFDHHRTAFQLDGAREAFEAGRDQQHMFLDADCSSCTKLIAEVARATFGFHDPALDELVSWADRVDAARFDDPEQALSHDDPIKRLVSVVEHFADDRLLSKLVPDLLNRPLVEVASTSSIRKRYRPLGKKLDRFVELLQKKCERRGRVVFADLTDGVLHGAGKFVTYALYPECVYSVVVGRAGKGAKILVGYNPWSGRPLDTDLSALCARYGGGGHPVVGGIPFGETDVEQARSIARAIANELAG